MKQISLPVLFLGLLLLLSLAFASSEVEKQDEKNATGDFVCGVHCPNNRCCAHGETCCSGQSCCRSGARCCGFRLCCGVKEYAAFVNAHGVPSTPAALAN